MDKQEHTRQRPKYLSASSHVHSEQNKRHWSGLSLLLIFFSYTSFCSVHDTSPSSPPPLHDSCAATHSLSHPHNITWHATQGRSMIPALFIPSALAIRLLPFPISPLGPLSVTCIRRSHFQRDNRAIKWTADDRQSGTSPLAVSPPTAWARQLNQNCYLPYGGRKKKTR